MIRGLLAAALVAAALALGSCTPDKVFSIVAAPEQKALEPLVLEFCKGHGRQCRISYAGSLDIAQMTAEAQPPPIDAVWPDSGVWIQVFDRQRRVQNLRAIAWSPLILGVRPAKARELGWMAGAEVRPGDVADAVRSGKLRLLMASPAHSGDGAAALVAMLTPEPGGQDAAGLAQTVLALTARVSTASGAPGRIGDVFIRGAAEGKIYDAVWISEAGLAETNDLLLQKGQEPLYAVYPAGGAVFADAALGYVERGQDDDSRAFFHALQTYLRSPAAQARLAAMSRRVGPGVARPAGRYAAWNLDPGKPLAALALPSAATIRDTLRAYQQATHRPTATAICLDFSDSMAGGGADEMKAAMRALLDPLAGGLAPLTARDRIIVIPFDDRPRDSMDADGGAAGLARLSAAVDAQRPAGRGDMYGCAVRAFELLSPYAAQGYRAAVIVMTNGGSPQSPQFESQWRSVGREAPVYGVTFGKANRETLDDLARLTRARVFDGPTQSAAALATARGYD